MDPINQAVALYPAYITKQPIMLIVKQHSNGSADGDFTCFRADSSIPFGAVGQKASSSRRRQLVDPATGSSLPSRQPRFSIAMKWKGWANFDITNLL
jgi:hypothetical protein